MFDMDPFGGKKVPCTKYQESGQGGFPEEPGQGGFLEEPGPGHPGTAHPLLWNQVRTPLGRAQLGNETIKNDDMANIY